MPHNSIDFWARNLSRRTQQNPTSLHHNLINSLDTHSGYKSNIQYEKIIIRIRRNNWAEFCEKLTYFCYYIVSVHF